MMGGQALLSADRGPISRYWDHDRPDIGGRGQALGLDLVVERLA
jgi:hypothetical protein